MGGDNFIPAREADLVNWSNNLATKVATYLAAIGITSAQSTSLNTQNDAWIAAYNTYQDPAQHTTANKILKNEAKDALVAYARELVGVIQKYPGTTDAQRSDLQINVPKSRTPIPAPESAPVFKSIVMTGRVAKVTIRGLDGDKRARPAGVQGALVMSFIGETPSDDLTLWKIEGLATKTSFVVTFAPTLPAGTQVWLTAAWYTARGMAGPACAGVSTIVGSGPGMLTIVDTEPASKKAA